MKMKLTRKYVWRTAALLDQSDPPNRGYAKAARRDQAAYIPLDNQFLSQFPMGTPSPRAIEAPDAQCEGEHEGWRTVAGGHTIVESI